LKAAKFDKRLKLVKIQQLCYHNCKKQKKLDSFAEGPYISDGVVHTFYRVVDGGMLKKDPI
jgi:hypothetical protein